MSVIYGSGVPIEKNITLPTGFVANYHVLRNVKLDLERDIATLDVGVYKDVSAYSSPGTYAATEYTFYCSNWTDPSGIPQNDYDDYFGIDTLNQENANPKWQGYGYLNNLDFYS